MPKSNHTIAKIISRDRLKLTLTGLVLVIVLIGVGIYWLTKDKTYQPILTMPKATEYNLADLKNQDYYNALQQAYTEASLVRGDADKLIGAYLAQADAYRNLGDTGREILVYKFLNSRYPKQSASFERLGDVYAKIGLIAEARLQYQTAQANDPSNTDLQTKINDLK